jgi:hypothetical protein
MSITMACIFRADSELSEGKDLPAVGPDDGLRTQDISVKNTRRLVSPFIARHLLL